MRSTILPERPGALLLDYGGTLDNGGAHWFRTIRNVLADLGVELDDDTFGRAFIYAERQMTLVRLVEPWFTFLDLMTVKMQLELRWLSVAGHVDPAKARPLALEAARRCDAHARRCAAEAAEVLERLHSLCPMVVVSNFYGNLDTVMRHLDLRRFFTGIVESATVGIRKPDPRMWAIGAICAGSDPSSAVAVGDNFTKDVCSALDAGCGAVWLRGPSMPGTDNASTAPSGRFEMITSLGELPALFGF